MDIILSMNQGLSFLSISLKLVTVKRLTQLQLGHSVSLTGLPGGRFNSPAKLQFKQRT